MLDFCSCKINLGLNVTEKRGDGFHNLETVFYPISWKDGLEVVESTENQVFKISFSGLPISGKPEDNLIYKAFQLIKNDFNIPPINIHLHKSIPMGAGLGGGSSNAATFINLLDKKFNLGISLEQKLHYASLLGSDCAFFIESKPVLAKGKGDIFEPITLNLNKYFILLIYPQIHCNTKLAFEGITPKKSHMPIQYIIEKEPIQQWRNLLLNDFEIAVFKQFPEIEKLKQLFYENGALYASMSGSGSTVYGIFEKKPTFNFDKNYLSFLKSPEQTF